MGEAKMQLHDLKSMSVDQLWQLRESVTSELGRKLQLEKSRLEELLHKLQGEIRQSKRRHYPPVMPKYRNPDNRSETWAGRGKQPRWVRAQLRSGKKLRDLLIGRGIHSGSRSGLDGGRAVHVPQCS